MMLSQMKVLASILLVALCQSAWAADAPKPASKPNILLIFSDDHAQHAISAYGSRVNATPHIDRLAKDGTRFANSFVANSICPPSRATLLTGQYSHLNGVPMFNRFDGSRGHVANRPRTGPRRFTSATTARLDITTPPRIAACAPPRTSSSTTGRRMPTKCST
jgi:hypothetical protein